MSLYTLAPGGQLQPGLSQEWLVTNGIGGYSSSTVVGCNTRRYHGLLCAATLPPVGRIIALSRVGEVMIIDGKPEPMFEFSCNQFGGTFFPRGDQYLQGFELGDFVRWQYDVNGVKVTKELQMPWLKNVTGIRYTFDPGEHKEVEIWMLPFVALRDFHATRRGGTGDFKTYSGDKQVAVATGDLTVYVAADIAHFEEKQDWWYGHTYAIEAERGQDNTEDLFTPGRFKLKITVPTSVTLWASLEPLQWPDWDAELTRRRAAVAAAHTARENVKAGTGNVLCSTPTSTTLKRLSHAANDFIVYRKAPNGKDGTTIIAGYPWFADWGRDTMISLPGLLLSTGRFIQAREVLTVFAQYVSEGMIPNRFDDYTNEPSYNTVDASLWFIHAAHEYVRLSGDYHTFGEILQPACQAIIDGYKKGTRFHIQMDPADGLITQGDAHTQLTWMDAKCEGITFTPRQGKAVEINALWYHALKLMNDNDLAAKVADNFQKAFWLSPEKGLADVVDDGPIGHPDPGPRRRDESIRPNQIFAVSLANSPLTPEQQAAVVEVVRRELLTPMGLRTLSKSNPNYKGYYNGPQVQRDAAYHNGTVWAWPLGAFLEAYLKVQKRSPESVEQAKAWLAPLIDGMQSSGCIGQISEIFEGDAPHRPVGCFAQAWSVAEVLRLALDLGA